MEDMPTSPEAEEDPTPQPAPQPASIPQPSAADRAVAVARFQNQALVASQNMAAIVESQLSMIEGLVTIGSFMVKAGVFGPAIDTVEKGAIVAATAFELGLSLTQAARYIDVIEGRPFIRARMKMALVNSRGPGRMFVTSRSSESVTVRGERPGFPITEVTYRLADAQRAGLVGKKAWQSNPIDMMTARASSTLADILWPEVAAGLPAAEPNDDGALEEMAPGEAGDVNVIDGTFQVLDPVDDPSRAAADDVLAKAKGGAGQNRSTTQGPRPGPSAAYATLTDRMTKTVPPLRMRELAAVVFPDGSHTTLTAPDLDRWIFEGDGRSPESLIAEAIQRRS